MKVISESPTNNEKVVLATTVYERSFRNVLDDSHWFFNCYMDKEIKKIVIVNNVNDESRGELNSLINLFSDRADFIDHLDIKKDALEFFGCDLQETEQSYWYSIQYFCQMFYAKNLGFDYLFNVGADCPINSFNVDDFIKDSIEILEKNHKVLLTTIPWSPGDFTETGNHEQNYFGIKDRDDLFWTSKVVSDQVFMVKISKLTGGIFNNKENLHPFPGYGGDSFEKRFCNHLIRNDFLRSIYKKHYYTHKSF